MTRFKSFFGGETDVRMTTAVATKQEDLISLAAAELMTLGYL